MFLKVKERSHGRSGAELESLTVYTVYYRRGVDEEQCGCSVFNGQIFDKIHLAVFSKEKVFAVCQLINFAAMSLK